MSKVSRSNIPIQIVIIILVLILQFLLIMFIESGNIRNHIDEKLYTGAKDIKYILIDGYINKDLKKDSFTLGENIENSALLNKKALEKGLSYFWIMSKDKDDIVYSVMSGSREEMMKVENSGYWASLKETEDDSFEESWAAFDSTGPVYIESTDIWGTYRSVYVPEVSIDGVKYIAGADITIESLNKEILIKTLKSFVPFFMTILIIIPILNMIIKNINEKKKMEKHISKMEKQDNLTSGFTRNYGLQILRKTIDEYHNSNKKFTICLVDIDNLSFINDTKGVEIGDDLLRILYKLVSVVIRKVDSIIRIDGNKMLILLPGATKKSSKRVFDNLGVRINHFNINNMKKLFLDINYIIVEYKGGELGKFLKDSQELLRIEGNEKKNSSEIIQTDMLYGIKNNEFKAYFQPKVHLKTKEINFEALVRWVHPEKGVISPNKFISIAEKSFLINDITKLVLKDSLELIEKTRFKISINLSPVSFENEKFMKDLKDILKKSKYAEYITFEITEGIAITDFEGTLLKMKSLKEVGISFAIDDFGTGYSSLTYLEKLPINEVKVDKSFVDNVETSKFNQLIVEFVNKMAIIQDFVVICEGTEEEDQINKLIKLGSHSFQGYFFGKPEPLECVIKKINEGIYREKIERFNCFYKTK